jgi:hypothetical protein
MADVSVIVNENQKKRLERSDKMEDFKVVNHRHKMPNPGRLF